MTWKIRATSARIKYAEIMMTDGRRPPHQELKDASQQAHKRQEWSTPYERQDIAKEPYDDEVQCQRIASE
jgi:hypothetical protein